jgi:hypothetical protein
VAARDPNDCQEAIRRRALGWTKGSSEGIGTREEGVRPSMEEDGGQSACSAVRSVPMAASIAHLGAGHGLRGWNLGSGRDLQVHP